MSLRLFHHPFRQAETSQWTEALPKGGLLALTIDKIPKLWIWERLIPKIFRQQPRGRGIRTIQGMRSTLDQYATLLGYCFNTSTQARFFFQIALPLSKAIIAILVLYYGVGHWNSYFSALVYISDKAKYPLQLVLRNILITNQTALSQTATTAAARAALQEKQQLIDVMKYSLIIISSIPVLVMYPLVQKHFVKGVMIGSMKG